MFFKYFSRQISFSRTFQDSPVYSSTFQACADPGYTGMCVYHCILHMNDDVSSNLHGLPWLRICCRQYFSQMDKVGAKLTLAIEFQPESSIKNLLCIALLWVTYVISC